MNKLTVVPKMIKDTLYRRGVDPETLRKASKMGEGPFYDVLEGRRIMNDFMMMRLADLTDIKRKEWERIQKKELEDTGFEIGDRGVVL